MLQGRVLQPWREMPMLNGIQRFFAVTLYWGLWRCSLRRPRRTAHLITAKSPVRSAGIRMGLAWHAVLLPLVTVKSATMLDALHMLMLALVALGISAAKVVPGYQAVMK